MALIPAVIETPDAELEDKYPRVQGKAGCSAVVALPMKLLMIIDHAFAKGVDHPAVDVLEVHEVISLRSLSCIGNCSFVFEYRSIAMANLIWISSATIFIVKVEV